MAPTRRTIARPLGKIPTTSVRRLSSPFNRSIGLVECNFVRCAAAVRHHLHCGRPWRELADRYSEFPIPQACLSATLELHGVASVSDAQAAEDAAGLFRHLQRADGDAGTLPPLRREPVPFRGVEFVRAPSTGVVAYREKLGAEVAAGTALAEIIDPASADPAVARLSVRCTASGVFFAKRHTMLVRPDDVIGKVAGPEAPAVPNQ